MARKTQTIEQLDASIKRWKTKLRRAVNTLGTLEKKRNRLAAKALVAKHLDPVLEQLGALSIRPKAEKVVVFDPEPISPVIDEIMSKPPSEAEKAANDRILEDSGIPAFLRRGGEASKAADQFAADLIKAEQATVKKAKAAGRIAKMKAKKAGDLKKMPLSGKAALDAIRNG